MNGRLWVLVSFARDGRCKPQSFPRERECTRETFGNALSTDWIPAFAGMTGVSKGIPSQMASPPACVEWLSLRLRRLSQTPGTRGTALEPEFVSQRGCDVHLVGAQRAVPLRPAPHHFVPPASASNGHRIK